MVIVMLMQLLEHCCTYIWDFQSNYLVKVFAAVNQVENTHPPHRDTNTTQLPPATLSQLVTLNSATPFFYLMFHYYSCEPNSELCSPSACYLYPAVLIFLLGYLIPYVRILLFLVFQLSPYFRVFRSGPFWHSATFWRCRIHFSCFYIRSLLPVSHLNFRV